MVKQIFAGPCDSHQDGDHHHGHQDPERVGGEGQEDQGAHQRRPEEVMCELSLHLHNT